MAASPSLQSRRAGSRPPAAPSLVPHVVNVSPSTSKPSSTTPLQLLSMPSHSSVAPGFIAPLLSSQSLHWLLPSKSASMFGLHAAQPSLSTPLQFSSTALLQISVAPGCTLPSLSLQSSSAADVVSGQSAEPGGAKPSVASQKLSPSSSQPSSVALLQ